MAHSLYIHIPFCLKRCIYCDFVSGIYNPEKADRYIEALKKEIVQLPNKASLSTLYIGGGTPTSLPKDTLSNLMDCIFKHFNFIDYFEATIEANPGTLDSNKLRTIRSSGINRISMGVQSFHNDELTFLGRIHTSEEAEQAVHLARDAGFKNIGIDLMYGLPGQSIERWKETLEKAVSLKPDHISAYELTVEEGTELDRILNNPPSPPFIKGGDSGGLLEDNIIKMYEYAIHYLTSHGFIHYEISNFAMPDHSCRHNLNYWNRGEYYGAGLAAHSFINGKRFYNTGSLDDYLSLISENRSPVKESEHITEDMALSEAIFLGLRKTDGINAESVSRRYKKDILHLYQQEIEDLEEAGLIEVTRAVHSGGTNIKLTRKGLSLSNEVFKKFI